MYLNEEERNEQMMEEAMLIIDSVAFLETQIHNALGELQEAANNRLFDDADRIEARIRSLLKKTNDENRNMDDFLLKYEDKINEKKTILSGAEQEEQIYDGCFPAQQRRASSRAALQRAAKKEKQGLAVNN